MQQRAYYAALQAADKLAEATPFVEYMLSALKLALIEAESADGLNGSEESSEENLLPGLLKANPQLTGKQAAEQLGLSQRAVEKQLAKLLQWPRRFTLNSGESLLAAAVEAP